MSPSTARWGGGWKYTRGSLELETRSWSQERPRSPGDCSLAPDGHLLWEAEGSCWGSTSCFISAVWPFPLCRFLPKPKRFLTESLPAPHRPSPVSLQAVPQLP